MSRVRNKFPAEIEAYCKKMALDLYQRGVKPNQIIKELENRGVRGVSQADITFWKRNEGLENKFRHLKNTENKAEKKEEPQKISEAFVVLPKSNIEHIKNLCNDILAQLEALEYEQ